VLTIRRKTGLRRRDFLQMGLLGPLGLSALALQPSGATAAGSFGRAKRCILVFLNGGPSQLDLWDMKPNAPADVRGELKPIATCVSGIQVSELLPLTAQQVDKFKIVRSVSHSASVHTTAMYTMLTGTLHPTPTVDQTGTRTRGDNRPGVRAGWRVAAGTGQRPRSTVSSCLPSASKRSAHWRHSGRPSAGCSGM
jgi:hypothetical protein